MGCDIHFFVEKRVDGVWTLIYPKLVKFRSEVKAALLDSFPGVLVDTGEELIAAEGTYGERREHPLYVSRDYDLFTILADVRRDSLLRSIAGPKGVPPDASPGYAWSVRDWERDSHSHSWFTVKELLDYDWGLAFEGVVYRTEIARFVEVTIPALRQLGDPDDVRICFFFDN